jgi:hypothetical protein
MERTAIYFCSFFSSSERSSFLASVAGASSFASSAAVFLQLLLLLQEFPRFSLQLQALLHFSFCCRAASLAGASSALQLQVFLEV